MAGAGGVGLVVVGFSAGLLADLDGIVRPRSVLVLEEPDVIRARNAADRIRAYSCVAGLLEAPTQREDDPFGLTRAVPRPPGVDAVMPAVEYGVVTAAALAQAWELPGAGLAAARIFRSKLELRRAADRAGIRQPRWRQVSGPQEVAEFRAELGGHCVLKPADGQASVGVLLLDADDDVADAWGHTATADEPTLRVRDRPAPPFLCEQRLNGFEVSVEALVANGKTLFSNVTDKLVAAGRHPVELGHAVPAALPASVARSLRDAVHQLVAATGFRCGVLHSEWIVTGSGPHLIECAARLPGDGIDTLIDLAYGGSLLADLLTVLSGCCPATREEAARGAAVRFLLAADGVVRAVRGVELARAAPGVHEVSVTVTPGARVGPPTSSWGRPGSVMATGENGAVAASRAEHAAGHVVIDVEDAGS